MFNIEWKTRDTTLVACLIAVTLVPSLRAQAILMREAELRELAAGWSHDIYSQEAINDECWPWVNSPMEGWRPWWERAFASQSNLDNPSQQAWSIVS